MAFAAETSALFSPGSGISLDRGWRAKRKLFPLGSVKRAFRGVTVRCVADLKCYNDSLTIKHQAEKRDDFLYGYSASRNNICNISFGFGSERQSVMKHKKFLSTRLIPLHMFTPIPFDEAGLDAKMNIHEHETGADSTQTKKKIFHEYLNSLFMGVMKLLSHGCT
jgi:hypothetical protein